jgi:Flp pilus assembly pilin Flp
MKRLLAVAARLVRDDRGQDLLEYGLLATLIGIVVMAGVTSLGNTINTVLWQFIAQSI